MIKYFLNIIETGQSFFVASNNMKQQKTFIAKHLEPFIAEAKTSNDGSLDAEDFKKIELYGLTIPAMLGEAFCVLRGRKMTDKERMSITFLASITGLFDDLFDKKDLPESYIQNLLDSPYTHTVANSNESLLIQLYFLGLELSDKQDIVKSYALDVYNAQVSSKRQNRGDLTREEIQQITFDKGGLSMPLYRCAFDGDIDEIEYKLLYYLGAIGQLENDIFDVYKDYISEIQTLVTTETDIATLRTTYLQLRDKIMALIEQQSYNSRNKRRFKAFANLVICRGLIGLDLLEKNANRTQGVFSIDKYDRKDLICDMESPRNVLKLLHYASLCDKK